MQSIDKSRLAGLFGQLREVFANQRDFLIDLDGKVGDSDLGLTMNKAFAAAADSVSANVKEPLNAPRSAVRSFALNVSEGVVIQKAPAVVGFAIGPSPPAGSPMARPMWWAMSAAISREARVIWLTIVP